MSLVSSFLDISGTSAGRILKAAIENPALPEEARNAFQCLIDMERFRGQAVHHLLSLITAIDANMKLVRRVDFYGVTTTPNTGSVSAAFDPTGNHLFGEGLNEILAINEDYISKKHTRRVEQALVKAILLKPAHSKQSPQGQYPQQKQAHKKRGKAKRPWHLGPPLPRRAKLRVPSM